MSRKMTRIISPGRQVLPLLPVVSFTQHRDALRRPFKSWHSVHACGHSKCFTHLSWGGARENVSRYMLCTFPRKAKGPLGRTESTELSVWTSTDSVVLTRHLHSPIVSTPHFSTYVILAATVVFFGNGKNKVMDGWIGLFG